CAPSTAAGRQDSTANDHEHTQGQQAGTTPTCDQHSTELASRIYQGLKTGRRVVVPGLKNKVIAQSARLVPRRLMTKVARRLWEDT
ncbi:MAG: hypothetical protein ACRDTA_09550, partial [Pseudonocardiaceae bacterium]